MADIDVDAVLAKLSISEKVDLLSGTSPPPYPQPRNHPYPNPPPGIDMWHTHPLPAHSIPSIRVTDGPNGVRGTRFFNGIPAACFPCGTALGATFNLPLLRAAGAAMGEEARAKGAHCILGPTINMQRSPVGGRGFESCMPLPPSPPRVGMMLTKG